MVRDWASNHSLMVVAPIRVACGRARTYHEDVPTALVLGAGGMFGAWEVGVWSVLREHVHVDMIVGASAGAWIGWLIACGATPDELAREWQDPATAKLMQRGFHRWG